jgi:hypothetical protein
MVAVTVAINGCGGQGCPIRSTGQVGPALTVPDTTATGAVLDG